jgi:taurine--2-oxoglutarate transaminase
MEEERMSKLNRKQTITYDKKYNQHPWLKGNTEPIPIEKAEGIFFYDFNGKKYYDMSSQLSCVNIGYGNEDVIQAINDQVKTLPYIASAYASAPRSELAKMLVELAPDNIAKVFFTCGGSDANEAAINMARTYTGRSKIFSRYRSYHGSTLGSGNLSGDPRRFALEHPAATGFVKFQDPYVYRSDIPFKNDQEASAYYINKIKEQIAYEGAVNIAAIFVESITFAKGVTSGYVQLGGIMISKEIAKFYEDKVFQYGLTYSGHSLACAAGVACVNYYKKAGLLENTQKVGKVLGELLEEIKQKHKCVGDVRYIGLFAAVEFVKDKETKEPLVPYADQSGTMGKIIGLLKERGFATFGRENNINIAPPLIITEEQLREAMKIFDEVLDIVDETYL